MLQTNNLDKNDQDRIEAIKKIIEATEKSLYSAKAMLSQIEAKAKPGIQKKTYGASPDGKIIEGVFDGQIMIGNDGKQYPVPANYASKSKLVEGDILKLTITDEGNFIYKQIGPVDRKRLIGIAREDESGNFIIEAEGKSYKVLLASITYYKVEPGDEVTLIVPKAGDPVWGAVDNIIRKGAQIENMPAGFDNVNDPFISAEDSESLDVETEAEPEKKARGRKKTVKKETRVKKTATKKGKLNGIVEEWEPEISELEKEAKEMEKNAKAEASPYGDDFPYNIKGGISIKVKNEDEDDDLPEEEVSAMVDEDFPDTADEIYPKKGK